MNRITLLLLALVFLVSDASAQPVRGYGLKIGVTRAIWDWNINGRPMEPLGPRVGLDAAFFAEWLNLDVVSIVSEVHYIQKGIQQDIPITTASAPDGTGSFVHERVRLDYLSIGILPKCRLDCGMAEYYLIGGIRFDISLGGNATAEADAPFNDLVLGSYQTFIDRFKEFQLGATVGIGAQLHALLPWSTGIEFRYSPNLQRAYSAQYADVTNTSFELLLTLSF